MSELGVVERRVQLTEVSAPFMLAYLRRKVNGHALKTVIALGSSGVLDAQESLKGIRGYDGDADLDVDALQSWCDRYISAAGWFTASRSVRWSVANAEKKAEGKSAEALQDQRAAVAELRAYCKRAKHPSLLSAIRYLIRSHG